MTFRHIVLFRLRDGVSDTEIEGAQKTLRSLGDSPLVLHWRIARSLDERKGTILIEDATFLDTESFHRFQDSAAHRAAGEAMARIADWWIGDYVA